MAVVNKTLDSIILKSLALHDLTNHYYVPFFLHAERCLEDLQWDTLRRVKTAVLPIADSDLATLPTDFVEEVYVGIAVGDKLKKLGHNNKLNPSDNSEDAFDVDTGFSYEAAIYSTYAPYWVDTYAKGKMFGRGNRFANSYRVLRDDGFIRFDNNMTDTSVVLVYLTEPTKVGVNSVVHPFAEETILEYIAWQVYKYDRSKRPFETREKKEDYNRAIVKLRARMDKSNTIDFVRSSRKGYKLSPKN
ncbi:MAG TPA: hypothetical protein ENH82_16590 [bacterium]|nr:hypothetical protein [bacterium]